jgi:hypothetical protein
VGRIEDAAGASRARRVYYTSWHLWFLAYLLIFSACSLPLFRPGARPAWFAALAGKWWGPAALVMPLAAIKVALGPAFAAYSDWSDTLVWFVAFVYGWLFMTAPRVFAAIERQALKWLAVGCVSFAVILGTFAKGYLLEWMAHPAYSPDYLIYQLLVAVNAWAWVLAVIGCGVRWLDFENRALRYASEATLPFYILHQVAVFTFATIVVEWRAGVIVKALVISTLAFAATMLAYQYLVRPIRLMRVLFGLRQPPATRSAAAVELAAATRGASPIPT